MLFQSEPIRLCPPHEAFHTYEKTHGKPTEIRTGGGGVFWFRLARLIPTEKLPTHPPLYYDLRRHQPTNHRQECYERHPPKLTPPPKTYRLPGHKTRGYHSRRTPSFCFVRPVFYFILCNRRDRCVRMFACPHARVHCCVLLCAYVLHAVGTEASDTGRASACSPTGKGSRGSGSPITSPTRGRVR